MTILEMSLGGAVLIAVILLLRHLALYRLPKWTFLLLWAVALCRLLVPFTLPSQLSVFTSAARIAEVFEEKEEVPTPPSDALEPVWVPAITVPGTFREDGWIIPAVPAPAPEPEPEAKPVSLLAAVYWTGGSLCGLFFAATYLWSLRRFWEAEQVESEFLRHWQEEHRVAIRTCAAVNAPLAYGLVRPVVLLPENTDWSDEDQLTYILTHEYVHIRRGDLFWKLLLTAALCVHWFNPLVWAMYLRANQDLELACDERVVRILGLENRKGYAYSLLAAAESGFSPLCLTYTTKHHMEERIRAIMKIKQKSAAAVLAAALLVTGVTAVFATSKAPEAREIDGLPSAVMTDTNLNSVPAQKPGPALADKTTPGNRVHPAISQPDNSADDTKKPVSTETDTTPTVNMPTSGTYPAYPVNSKGETYGIGDTVCFDPNAPDLIAVPYLEDGKNIPIACYIRNKDLKPYQYPNEIKNPDDAMDYMAWVEKLPYSVTLPCYDSEGNSMGTTEVILNDNANDDKLDLLEKDLESALEEIKNNRWGVPYGEIPEGTEFQVANYAEVKELCDYLHDVRGIKNGDIVIRGDGDENAPQTVCVAYYMTKQEEESKVRLTNGYPVNSKGETYGKAGDLSIVGSQPDLIAVVATNGKEGYAFLREMEYGDYQGETDTPEGFLDFVMSQPKVRLVKVYDVNRDNVIGYFRVADGRDSMTQEEELEMIANQMRKWGNSEEQIAADLEYYKQSRGWD